MASERHREAIQRQIHQDWANREYIEVIANSIKKITAFLNSFGECLVIQLNRLITIICAIRHVLPVALGRLEREADNLGAEDRLSGGVHQQGLRPTGCQTMNNSTNVFRNSYFI